jgi:hypothetical protein
VGTYPKGQSGKELEWREPGYIDTGRARALFGVAWLKANFPTWNRPYLPFVPQSEKISVCARRQEYREASSDKMTQINERLSW